MTDKVTPIESALMCAAILGKLEQEKILKLLCDNGQRLPDKNDESTEEPKARPKWLPS